MDENKTEVVDYLARQNFSEQELDNLHQGKQEYKELDEGTGN